MRKTLITGVPGWLGSRLAEVLADPNQPLNRFSGYAERNVRCLVLPESNHAFLNTLNVEVCPGNVLDEASLTKAMEGIDTVFHLVGIIHPKRISELYAINRDGLKNVLAAAEKANVKRVVFVSSNSPAGNNLQRSRLMKEEDPPHPYKNYGKSKLEAENIALQYHKEGKLEVVIVRPCWFYGPGQPARQTRFFRMVKGGRPLIFGDGKNLRSMSYLDNTIQGLLLAEANVQAGGSIYWLADETPYETNHIYQTVAELLGVKLNPIHIPRIASQCCELVDDVTQAVGLYSTDFHVAGEMVYDIACSIDKAKRELGYRPEIDLREGMQISIEWCRNNGENI